MIGKRVVFEQKGIVKVQEFNIPHPSEDEVLVKTICSLISPGTELAFLLGLPNTSQKFPMKTGYSNIGRIIEVGKNIDRSYIGKIVASASPHSSHNIKTLDDIFLVPESLSPEKASFFHLCAIALQGVRKGDIEIGNSVAIIGLGVVGLLALQLAKLSGGFPVIGIDLVDYRLEKAKEAGADYTINPLREGLHTIINEITENKGADVVIEASGSPEAINTAFEIASRRGRVILLGSTRGVTTVNFYSLVHRKGLFVIGAHNSVRPRKESFPHYWTLSDDVKLSLRLLARDKIKVDTLITGVFPIDKAESAYQELLKDKGRHITILLKY